MSEMKTKNIKTDFFENLIKMIENVDEKHYKSPYVKKPIIPRNPISKRIYSGCNRINLFLGVLFNEIQSDQFSTFKQITKEEFKLRKGSKSQNILTYISCYYLNNKRISQKDYDQLSKEEKENCITKGKVLYHFVFSYQDIEGNIPEFKIEIPNIVEFIQKLNVKITEKPVRHAYYISNQDDLDEIVMPLFTDFKSENEYYHVLMHELIHWSLNVRRLNLKTDYDREELIAEIGSMLLSLNFGLNHNTISSAIYIKSYLKKIDKEIKTEEVIKAYTQAQKAVDFLLNSKEIATKETVNNI